MDNKLKVQLLGNDSIDEQVTVFMKAFDLTESFENVRKFWINKHYDNPISPSYIFGVYDGDMLVSENVYLPQQYFYNSKIIEIIQSCESGTIPEYRGRGLWRKVVIYAVEYFADQGKYDALIGFPNYETSFPGFMKMRWDHILNMDNYIMVLNPINFAKCYFGKELLFSKILAIQRIRTIDFKRKYQICEVGEDKKQYLQAGIELIRGESFYRWKEKYKKLKMFGLDDNSGNYVATCSYINGSYNNYPMIYLLNIVTEDTKIDEDKIYGACINELYRRYPDAALIRSWAVENSKKALRHKKLLFIKAKHKNPFIVYQLKEDNIKKAELLKIENWSNLSFLNLD